MTDELDAIYRATTEELASPLDAMDRYHAEVLDPRAADGLWQRYRTALHRHSASWASLSEWNWTPDLASSAIA